MYIIYIFIYNILISFIVGALITLPIVSTIGKKYGSGVCLLFGSLWLCMSIPLLGIKGIGLPILYPSMFGVGIGLGFTDVGMTSQAILVEKQLHVNRMGFFQASMSIGSFVGVITGGIFSAFGMSPFIDFLSVSLFSLPISVCFYFYLYNFEEETVISDEYALLHVTNIVADASNPLPQDDIDILTETSTTATTTTATTATTAPADEHHYMLYLCIIGFCAQIGEGTISDWCIMYFADDLDASPMVSITGYAAFSLMMAVGRVMGDDLGMKYGRNVLLKCSGALATVGLGIAVLAPSLISAGPIYWAVFGLTLAGEYM